MNKQTLILLLLTVCQTVISKDIPLPEHPRPDFERSEWINLNGEWAFTFNNTKAEKSVADNNLSAFDLTINVPFPWGSKLSGITNNTVATKLGDKGWYARAIDIPEVWKDKRIFLVVGAADWKTNVWLDGKPLGEHQGGYTPFEFELTDLVKYGARQNLFISVDDTPSNQRLYGKQGYGDARGIWQTVYLEARGDNYIDYVHFSPDIDRSTVGVEVAFKQVPAKKAQIEVLFKNGEQKTFTYSIKGKAAAKSLTHKFEIKLDNQHLWDLDDPYLYEVEVSLKTSSKKENTVTDMVSTYFGQRKIGVTKLPGYDYPYISLNNKPLYMQACLDQSYHPEGFYTFPSDAFMRDEILLSKRLGLNANRIHIKVEIPRKLYWADRLGLLIMADTPNFWGEPDEAARQDWEYCLHQQVKRDFNHPSIFAWVNFNETWGLFSKRDAKNDYYPETQEWVRRMYKETKRLDPTRIVEDNSPCNRDHVESDINTFHMYLPGYEWKQSLDNEIKNTYVGSKWNYIGDNVQNGVPMLNSECGNVWGYSGSTGDVDYTWDYHIMMNEFRSHPLCAGWLYTEHHDVINEWNGYVRYDRSAKYDGLDAFVPNMSIADLHSSYYIAPQGDLCREAKAGETIELPLFASFMTDKNPGALSLKTTLVGSDALGNETVKEVMSYPITFRPYMNELIAPAKVTLPQQKGLYTLRLELQNADSVVVGRNFALFRVKDGVATTSNSEKLLTLDPAKFTAAEWSVKQWNVFDGLKVNGAGSGFFEYTIPWSSDIKLSETTSVTLIFEASAKKLWGKDNDKTDFRSGDNMLGQGEFDNSKNPNAYPQTGEQTYPSWLKVSVNGVVCGDFYLPNDPADHRGALSWLAQPHNKKLSEAGSYGYLLKAIIPIATLKEGENICIRFEIPQGVDGGLAIYGKDFGRYPLDPTLVFRMTD
ncbi:MAG: glycoside hydrolase family 2 [Dysgonamonadaceae bacterium]|jgi:hypothetical protein|nr:glycoside hydrolase family 2 [Dysgonamonadaceae bacterium]